MSAVYRSILLSLLLAFVSQQTLAMQLTDARSAAVYILQQRPLINACLNQADASNNLSEIWSSDPCQQLLNQDPQLTLAWQLIFPQGEIRGLALVPYSLRKPTMDSYSEYKRLAERIAQLSRWQK